MLANLTDIFNQLSGGAAAAFNVFGYEDSVAVIKAAEKLHYPVVLMTNKPAIAHMPLEIFAPMLRTLAEGASVPVCVHLDHSTSVEDILRAVELGYTSVMFDGSQLPEYENIEITQFVVKSAHPRGVSVEAEIGSVGYADPAVHAVSCLTRPEAAEAFASQTAVDALAVAVGTVHRMTAQNAKLDFDLLQRIKKSVSTPLVIHGSTGVADEDLKRLVQNGVKKVNIGTSLRMAFGNSLRRSFEQDDRIFDRIQLFQPAMAAVEEKATEKIKLLMY